MEPRSALGMPGPRRPRRVTTTGIARVGTVTTTAPGWSRATTTAPGWSPATTTAPGWSPATTTAPGWSRVTTTAPGWSPATTTAPGWSPATTTAPGGSPATTTAPGWSRVTTTAGTAATVRTTENDARRTHSMTHRVGSFVWPLRVYAFDHGRNGQWLSPGTWPSTWLITTHKAAGCALTGRDRPSDEMLRWLKCSWSAGARPCAWTSAP